MRATTPLHRTRENTVQEDQLAYVARHVHLYMEMAGNQGSYAFHIFDIEVGDDGRYMLGTELGHSWAYIVDTADHRELEESKTQAMALTEELLKFMTRMDEEAFRTGTSTQLHNGRKGQVSAPESSSAYGAVMAFDNIAITTTGHYVAFVTAASEIGLTAAKGMGSKIATMFEMFQDANLASGVSL